jgi:hypothetical protein
MPKRQQGFPTCRPFGLIEPTLLMRDRRLKQTLERAEVSAHLANSSAANLIARLLGKALRSLSPIYQMFRCTHVGDRPTISPIALSDLPCLRIALAVAITELNLSPEEVWAMLSREAKNDHGNGRSMGSIFQPSYECLSISARDRLCLSVLGRVHQYEQV